MFALWEKSYDKTRQHIKKERHHFANKCPSSQSCDFSSSHVWMWELDHKEGWVPKNVCVQIVVLEKTLESPLDSKEIKPVNHKGNQPWIFIGRTDVEAEALVLMGTSWAIGKPLILGKIEGRRRRRWQVGWYHRLNGHEFEQTLGDSEGQGSLACYSPWGCKGSDTT